MDQAAPGEILPGIEDAVPPARSEWENLAIGEIIPNVRVWSKKKNDYETLPGSHFGSGVVILDRDAVRTREFIRKDLETPSQKLSPHTLASLLQSFFGGHSYTRLYQMGASRGTRLNKNPFLYSRLECIRGMLSVY